MKEAELLRREALDVGTAAYLAAARDGDEEDAARILGEMKALELLDPGVTAGVPAAELKVMREAARLAGAGSTAGDPFGVLAGPFSPGPPGGRSSYTRTGGVHWCTAAGERP